MTDRINQHRSKMILLAITVVGFTIAVVGYSYLIASSCGASGASEFFSSIRSFHTQDGC